jgi:tetratricopeptide (TPR) repeat protein
MAKKNRNKKKNDLRVENGSNNDTGNELKEEDTPQTYQGDVEGGQGHQSVIDEQRLQRLLSESRYNEALDYLSISLLCATEREDILRICRYIVDIGTKQEIRDTNVLMIAISMLKDYQGIDAGLLAVLKEYFEKKRRPHLIRQLTTDYAISNNDINELFSVAERLYKTSKVEALIYYFAGGLRFKNVLALEKAEAIAIELSLFETAYRIICAQEPLIEDKKLFENKLKDFLSRTAELPIYLSLNRTVLDKLLSCNPESRSARKFQTILTDIENNPQASLTNLKALAIEQKERAQSARIYLNIAYLLMNYFGESHIAEVEENLTKAISLNPVSYSTLKLVSEFCLRFKTMNFLDFVRREFNNLRIASTRIDFLLISYLFVNQSVLEQEGMIDLLRSVQSENPNSIFLNTLLGELSIEKGDYTSAIRLFSSCVSVIKEEENRIRYVEMLAFLCKMVENYEEAYLHYLEVLKVNGPDILLIRSIIDTAKAAGVVSEIGDIYFYKSFFLYDGKEKAESLIKSIELYIGKGDIQSAFRSFIALFKLDPLNRTIVGFIEQFIQKGYSPQSILEQIVPFIDEIFPVVGDRYALIPLLKKIANIYHKGIGDIDAAVKYYRLILSIDSEDIEVVKTLSSIAMTTQAIDDVEAAIRKEIELSNRLSDRVQSLKKLAQIKEERRQDYLSAISLYKEVLESDPTDDFARNKLKELYRKLKMVKEYKELLEGEIASAAHIRDRNRKRLEISEVLLLDMDDPEGAFEQLYEVYKSDSENEEVYRLLSIFVDKGVLYNKISPLYKPYLLQKGDYHTYIKLIESDLKSEKDNNRRLQLLRDLAEVYEKHLNMQDLAFNTRLRIFNEQPGDRENIDYLMKMSEVVRGEEELARVFMEMASSADCPEDIKPQILKYAADIYENKLNNVEGLKSSLKMLSAILRDDVEILNRLIKLSTETSDYLSLAESLYLRAMLHMNQEERVRDLVEAARIYEVELKDDVRAISVLSKVLELDPTNLTVIRRLARLLEKTMQWAHLVDIIKLELNVVTEPAERSQVFLRLGDVYLEKLENIDEALKAYKESFRTNIVSDAALTRIIGLFEEIKDFMPVYRFVEEVYTSKGEWGLLANFYIRTLPLIKDREVRKEIYFNLADIYESRLNQPDLLYSTLCKAMRDLPEYGDVADRLENAALKLNLFEETIEFIDELTGDERLDPSIRASLYARAARLADSALGNVNRALEYARKASSLAPDVRDYIEMLEKYEKSAGKYSELLNLYEHKIKIARDDNERRNIYLEMSEVLEKNMEDTKGAAEVLLELYRKNPADIEVFERLLDVCERGNEYGILSKGYEKRIEFTEDEKLSLDLMLKLAELKKERLSDYEGALNIVESVLNTDPSNQRAIKVLDDIFNLSPDKMRAGKLLLSVLRQNNQRFATVRVLEVLASFTENTKERIDYLVEAAEISFEEGNKGRAVEFYLKAFGIDYENIHLLKRLIDIAESDEHWEQIAMICEEALSNMLTEETMKFIKKQLADIRLNRLNDSDGAFTLYKELVLEDMSDVDMIDILNALEAKYRDIDDKEGLLDVLKRRLRFTEDDKEKINILMEISDIQIDSMERLDVGFETLKQIVEIDPQNEYALKRIAEIASNLGRWQELRDSLLKLVEMVKDENELSEYKFELGLVYEERFNEIKTAFKYYEESYGHNNANSLLKRHLKDLFEKGKHIQEVVSLLTTIYLGENDFEGVISVYEKASRMNIDKSLRLEYMRRVADIYRDNLNQPEMAFLALIKLLREFPEQTDIFPKLESIAEEVGSFEEVVGTLEEIYIGLKNKNVKVEYARKLGEIYEERIKDQEQAMTYFEEVIASNPSDEMALASLDRIYRLRGDWEKLTSVIEEEIKISRDEEERLNLIFRLAKVLEEKLSDPKGAIVCYNRILEVRPDHRLAIRSLEKLYESLKDFNNLKKVLELELGLVTEEEERLRIKTRLANILGSKIGETSKSIEIYKEVFESDNSNDEAFEALEKYYSETQNYNELVTLYRRYIDAIVDKSKSIPFRIRLADILTEKLSDLEGAKLVLNEAMAIDPQNVRLLTMLKEIYKRTGEFVEEAAILKRLIPLQEDTQRLKEYRLELMELLGDKLGRREEAIEIAKRVLDIEPHTLEELQRVASVLRSLFAYEELITVLELIVDMVEGEEKFAYYREIGTIYLDNLNDERQGLLNFEKAFEIKSNDYEVFDKIVTLIRRSQKLNRLPAFYEKMIQSETDSSKKKEMIRTLAEIYENELDDVEMAFLTWCRVLKEDYKDREVLSKVESLAEKTELYEELYAIYEEAIDSVSDNELIEYFKKRQAELSIEKLGEKAEAERHYKEVIELNPDNIEAYHKLQDLYEKDERYIDLIDIIDREIQVTKDTARRIELYIRIADIYFEKIGNADEASGILKKALAIDGSNRELLYKMVNFYEKTERYEELAQSLKRLIDNVESVKQIEYLKRLGEVYETKLGQDEKAIESYLSILDIDPKNLMGLKALENIYKRLNMHEELVGVYEDEIPLIDEPSEVIDLHFKAGSIYEDILSNFQKAIEHYNAILEIDPTDLNAIKHLERCYSNIQDYEYLVDTYKRHVELLEDPEEKVEILIKMAIVSRDNLKRVDLAETYFTQVLKYDPNNREAIHNLAELYEKSGNWFNAVEMLKKEADSLGSDVKAVKIYYRLGKIHEEMLLDLESAKESYRKAIEIDPSFIDAVRALRGIYGSEKDLNNYIEIMKHEAKYISDPEEKKRLYFEIGKIYEDEKNDIEQAKTYYEEVLKIDFGYVPVAKILADIYFREENWQRAESCLQVVVKDLERSADRKEVARQYYRLGYIAEKLNDMQKAMRYYQTAYDLDPTYLPVMESLAIGYTQLEMWDKASAMYQNMIMSQKDVLSDAELIDIYYQIGEIERRLGNLEKALSFLRKAYEIDDQNLKVLTLLKEIYSERQEWDDVYDVYLQIISVLPENERFERYMELGTICVSKLNDVFRAIDAYSGALRSAKTPEEKKQAMDLLYPLYVEARQPQKAVNLLKELVDVEKDKEKLKVYYLKIAELNRKSLSNLDEALTYYNKVLDVDPNYTQAFAEIEKILADRRDWKGLEEAYRNMIQRTPKDQKARRLILWKTLADLYYRALRNPEAAIMAYEVVAGLDKDNAEVLDILAELYSSKEKYREKAIKTYHKLIKITTNPVKVCKALKRLYIANKQYDRVYIICNVLKFLKQADAEDERIITQLRSKLKDVAAKSITENLWETSILHEQAKGVIAAIFATVLKKYPELFFSSPEAFGLKKNDYIDINTSQLFVASMLRYVKGVLNIPALQAYKGPPGSSGIRLVATNPPAVVLGEDMFKERSKKEIWLLLAKELTLVRPEFFILTSKPSEHLDAILNAILAVANPAALSDGNPLLNQEYARLFAPKMTQDNIMLFKALASRYLNEKVRPGMEDFKEGVELSTIRAGVAITQDFEFAINMIQKIPFRVYRIPPRTLLREIVIYYMSEEYMDLREKLGLSVSV